VTVNIHTNYNNRISLTSFQQLAAEILQQPLPPRAAKYISKLAATIIKQGDGYMEDDVWDAHQKLKLCQGIPYGYVRY
jgi:hypothetical protein